jgi:outer membrane protein assembly factor BamE (lipoprotein component of BamABCDE complex)
MRSKSFALVLALGMSGLGSFDAVAVEPSVTDETGFAEQAAKVKVGTTQQRVRELLGKPRSQDEKSWHYRNPPNRPDGPYHWYTFTFENGKVVKVEDGGVACNYRI